MTGSVLDNPSPELLEVMFGKVTVTSTQPERYAAILALATEGQIQRIDNEILAALADFVAEDKDYTPGGCE
jgi:hypothetical protein